MSIQAMEMLQLLATDAAKAGNEWDVYFQEPLDLPISSLFVNVLCRCISFIQFSLHPCLWQLAALSLSISRRLFRAACSLICWLPSVMSFSLHGGGTLLSLFYRFLLVSLFSFFCFLPLSFHHLKGLLYLSLPPPLSFTHFIFSPFPTAVVKSEPRATSSSSRPVHLVRSSLLSSLLAITLPLCTFFFLHLPFHFRFLCHPPLPLQGAVTSDLLFDSLLALRSRCAYECPHGGESECLLLSHSPLCVCVCMLRAV